MVNLKILYLLEGGFNRWLKGLEEGLSALIPENPIADILDSDLTKESLDLDMNSIEPNKNQQTLKDSLKLHLL